jgi:hypothetical protein
VCLEHILQEIDGFVHVWATVVFLLDTIQVFAFMNHQSREVWMECCPTLYATQVLDDADTFDKVDTCWWTLIFEVGA